MEGYYEKHSKEVLETGGDDWPYSLRGMGMKVET